jgi:hypothetical protein
MCGLVFFFFTNLSTIFLIVRSTEGEIIKNVCAFMLSSRYSYHLLMKLEFLRQLFGKTLRYQT